MAICRSFKKVSVNLVATRELIQVLKLLAEFIELYVPNIYAFHMYILFHNKKVKSSPRG